MIATLQADLADPAGSGCRLKPGLRVKFPWRVVVGHHCWLAEDAWIDNLAPVTLGDRVCLSQGGYLGTGNHNFRSPGFDLLLGPITIGPDAWIASRAVLAPGSQVGPAALVALGAVVVGWRGLGGAERTASLRPPPGQNQSDRAAGHRRRRTGLDRFHPPPPTGSRLQL